MTDRGIAFSPPMVRALVGDTKTQTRRIIKPCPWPEEIEPPYIAPYPEGARAVWHDSFDGSVHLAAPWVVGDRLYVRENYYQRGHWEPVVGVTTPTGRQKWAFVPDGEQVLFDPPPSYRVSMAARYPETVAWHKRLGRFMPRKYSRLTLTVTDVRVQQVQAISREDAIAEGLIHKPGQIEPDWWLLPEPYHQGSWLSPVAAYSWLWNALHTAPGERWDDNPWVVALTFEVRKGNIDETPR